MSALRDEPLTIYGDGKQVRDVLYVEDLIRAYDAFLQNPVSEPRVYNVGGGSENITSLLEFLDLLEAELGSRPDVMFEDWREGDQKVYISDISRASESLDWQPSIGFREGINRYLRWANNIDD